MEVENAAAGIPSMDQETAKNLFAEVNNHSFDTNSHFVPNVSAYAL
jgi:hypothetical protein